MADSDLIMAAERASRGRAAIMAIAALVLIVNAVIEVGEPPYAVIGWRSGIWIFLILMWLLILASGGGLNWDRARRKLMNDELSLQNRARALALGFYVTMLAALILYCVSWFQAIEPHDSERLITATGVASALGRYAWLEAV
jgi:hypothetical protein